MDQTWGRLWWVWTGGGLLAVLCVASLLLIALRVTRPERNYTELTDRIVSWWWMSGLLAGAMALGAGAVAALFAFISFVALREYLSITPSSRADRWVALAAYAAVLVNYVFIGLGIYGIFVVFIPVYALLAAPVLLMFSGETRRYLVRTGALHWGLMTTTYCLGYAAMLMHVPLDESPHGGAALLAFLLIVTAANDVLQYAFGKLLGRHKVAPRISPNKTWEGLLGGWAATAAVAFAIGLALTPLRGGALLLTSALLPAAGFAGDLAMSAIKRDLGVKDTSRLIPGHGGALDRLDSLIFTAPLFFHLLAFFALERF